LMLSPMRGSMFGRMIGFSGNRLTCIATILRRAGVRAV
jgi:hypothetical protein